MCFFIFEYIQISSFFKERHNVKFTDVFEQYSVNIHFQNRPIVRRPYLIFRTPDYIHKMTTRKKLFAHAKVPWTYRWNKACESTSVMNSSQFSFRVRLNGYYSMVTYLQRNAIIEAETKYISYLFWQRRATLLFLTWIYSCDSRSGRDCQSFTNFHITNSRSWV